MQEFDIPIVVTIEAHTKESAVKIAEIIAERLEEDGEVTEVRDPLVPIVWGDIHYGGDYVG